MDQLANVKRELRSFQVMFGLKINFQKNYLFEINMDRQILVRWADVICYEIKSLPSTYLELPLGVSSNFAKIWKPVVAKFEKRLVG